MGLIKEPVRPGRVSSAVNMDTITIAIIGANGVGKSAFIQRALKLSRLPNQNIVTFNWTEFDGSQHVVNALEVDLEAFDMEMNGPIRWPKQANGQMAPPVDGALVLYDVMNKDSINPLTQTLCESTLVPTGSDELTAEPGCSIPLRIELSNSPRRDEMRQSRGNKGARCGKRGRCLSRCGSQLQHIGKFPKHHAGVSAGYIESNCGQPER